MPPFRSAVQVQRQGPGWSKLGRRQQTKLLAKFCQARYPPSMGSMNISLPDPLKAYVDEQVTQRGYGTSSEYVRELIRKDQDRHRLRSLLLEGAASEPGATADAAFCDQLRERARQLARPGKKSKGRA